MIHTRFFPPHCRLLVLTLFLCVASAAPYDPYHYCLANQTFLVNSRPGFSLQQVRIVFRHGDRVPIPSLPAKLQNAVWSCDNYMVAGDVETTSTDSPTRTWRKTYIPNREVLPGNCYAGQLTSRGAQQHRLLGAQFRSTYVDQYRFLSPTYNASQCWFRSTDVPRTIQSVWNFFEGLYPGTQGLLPLNIIEEDRDNMGGGNRNLCPALSGALTSSMANPQVQAFYNAKLKPLADKLSQIWGFNITYQWLDALNDITRARVCHNQPFIPGMSSDDAFSLMQSFSAYYNSIMNNKTVLKFAVGSFLQDFLADLANPLPLRIYSAHDSTVRVFMMALHAFDNFWPPYASHAALEIWKEDATSKLFVVLQYDGQVRPMLPPCTSDWCDMASFQSLLQSYDPGSSCGAPVFKEFSMFDH